MKPFESQSTSPKPETEFVSCQAIAPLLMELFDGEADEISAKRARAHLLACQHCAQAWLEWNQTQSILRTHPVPAPPPTLLWRILLATRFAGFKSQNRFAFFGKKKAPAFGALYDAFEPHEAPASMQAQIFAATSRQKKAKAPVAWAELFGTKKKVAWPAFSMLAAPALAAFLFVVSRDTVQELPLAPIASESQPIQVEEAPVANPVSKPRIAASANAPKKAVSAPIAKSNAKAEVRESAALTPRVQPKPERVVAEVETTRRPTARYIAIDPVEAPRPVRIHVNVIRPETRPEPVRTVVEKPRPVVAPPVETVAFPRPVRAAKPALSDDVETPVSTVATIKPAAPRLARLLASATNHSPVKVTRPAAAGPRFTTIAANFSDADSDQHIDELQSVVADFRSSISDDGSEDLSTADES